MNQHQLLCQLERLNDQIGYSVEGLSAVAHMVDICDQENAPMPLQLAELLRVVVGYTANTSNLITKTIEELKACN